LVIAHQFKLKNCKKTHELAKKSKKKQKWGKECWYVRVYLAGGWRGCTGAVRNWVSGVI